MKDQKLILSSSPHIRSEEDVLKIMRAVIYALLPASIASIYFFGLRSLFLILTCVVAAVLTEFVFEKIRKREVTITDSSAIITGLLLALTLPPEFPYFAAVIGAVVAIVIGKQIFGGLGYNIFNPALVGRAFLVAAFPVLMTTWERSLQWLHPTVETITTATPLALMKFEGQSTSYLKLFLGNVSGCIGETSVLALLIGAAFLLYKGYINWRIPTGVLGSVVIFGGLFWLINPAKYPDPLFHLLAGGLIIGAFFMATDLVTTPITQRGCFIFGVGVGALVVLIRLFGGLPEGVMYAILIMNALTPLINRYTRPRIFGQR